MATKDALQIGTCSWKYDSWRGLIYPEDAVINYLSEYARHYRTVEIDQWFWSLFNNDQVVLPKPAVVREYADSITEDFRFGIKVPNSITLTHHYTRGKQQPLVPNPHFLSVDLMERFLERIEPLRNHLGPLIFQFEYLNKQKVPRPQNFLEQLGDFSRKLPEGYLYCVEIRNPNYLNNSYFNFLRSHNLSHVFLQGYYMPSIFELYAEHREDIKETSVIRLLGPNRQDIEKRTGKDWSRIVAPRDHELEQLVRMLSDLAALDVKTYLYVNNHFEGSAPRTIARIEQLL